MRIYKFEMLIHKREWLKKKKKTIFTRNYEQQNEGQLAAAARKKNHYQGVPQIQMFESISL